MKNLTTTSFYFVRSISGTFFLHQQKFLCTQHFYEIPKLTLLTSSSFSFFTHHSFFSSHSLSWELFVRCCVHFGRGALVTVVRWQVVIGVVINGGGTLILSLEFQSSFIQSCNPYKTCGLTICIFLMNWQSIWNLRIANP